ncbi:recombinase family protein, partial [Cetobacterium sp.]|uniref:recombinase family protein n=1 Tax=Cetobacterium sp. TaxID=2071632 RepID=UPI003F3127DC
MKRVVGYVRISTESQKDNTSIELQIEKIELQCKLNDLELVRIFKDEGFSAKEIKRAAYLEMMDFIENEENEIQGLFVYKADRIHRSLKNLLTMIDRLNDLDIAFKSITEQFDTTTAQGVLFLQMIGSFAEFERKLIAERTKSGRIANAENNFFGGGSVPIGYLVQDKKILIDE